MTFDHPPTLDLPTLRKIARDTVARWTRAQGGLLSAYLVGSVAANEPPLGNAADIDLILIHDAPPAHAREILPLNDAVVLDLTHHTAADYADAKGLRVHPWRGPEMCEPLFLHDPAHFFERAQAGARGQFHRPDHVAARARAFEEWAREAVGATAPLSREAKPERGGRPGQTGTSAPTNVQRRCEALLFAANAVISLTGFPASARKLMLKFDGAARRLGRPELYEAMLTALGGSALTAEDIEAMLLDWRAAYQAGPFTASDTFAHPARLVYYASGFRALLDASRPRATLWPLLMTWASVMESLEQNAPAEVLAPHRDRWREVAMRLELDSPARTEATTEFVRQCEMAVEQWADENGA